MRKFTTEEWVALASDIHNGKFDYSLVNYTGSQDPVTIVCPECDAEHL